MATQTIKINRSLEHIVVRDEDGAVACDWEVRTDDASMQRMTSLVGDAMDRFHALSDELGAAESDEDRKRATGAMARLFKRTTCAIIGEQGWEDVLTYIGDGEPVDPAEHVNDLGEVFAALVSWLWEHCSNKQLREAGVYFKGQQQGLPKNRAARRSKGGKKKAR